IEESSDSDSESEYAEEKVPTVEDEDPVVRDDGLAARDEGPDMRVESLSLEGMRLYLGIALGEGRMPSVFEVGQGFGSVPKPERPKRVSALRRPTLTTRIDPEDSIACIDIPASLPPAPPVQPPSPEWSSGSLLVSPAPSIVPLTISSPMITLRILLPIASPATEERRARLDLVEIVDSMKRGQDPRRDV
nr:hypothetical protein [Tanacetum cinerariifolium]